MGQEKLEQAVERVKKAEADLREAKQAYREALEEHHGLRPGVRVKADRGIEGEYVSIDAHTSVNWTSRPWIKARLFKKDGTLGERVQTFYRWKLA